MKSIGKTTCSCLHKYNSNTGLKPLHYLNSLFFMKDCVEVSLRTVLLVERGCNNIEILAEESPSPIPWLNHWSIRRHNGASRKVDYYFAPSEVITFYWYILIMEFYPDTMHFISMYLLRKQNLGYFLLLIIMDHSPSQLLIPTLHQF